MVFKLSTSPLNMFLLVLLAAAHATTGESAKDANDSVATDSECSPLLLKFSNTTKEITKKDLPKFSADLTSYFEEKTGNYNRSLTYSTLRRLCQTTPAVEKQLLSKGNHAVDALHNSLNAILKALRACKSPQKKNIKAIKKEVKIIEKIHNNVENVTSGNLRDIITAFSNIQLTEVDSVLVENITEAKKEIDKAIIQIKNYLLPVRHLSAMEDINNYIQIKVAHIVNELGDVSKTGLNGTLASVDALLKNYEGNDRISRFQKPLIHEVKTSAGTFLSDINGRFKKELQKEVDEKLQILKNKAEELLVQVHDASLRKDLDLVIKELPIKTTTRKAQKTNLLALQEILGNVQKDFDSSGEIGYLLYQNLSTVFEKIRRATPETKPLWYTVLSDIKDELQSKAESPAAREEVLQKFVDETSLLLKPLRKVGSFKSGATSLNNLISAINNYLIPSGDSCTVVEAYEEVKSEMAGLESDVRKQNKSIGKIEEGLKSIESLVQAIKEEHSCQAIKPTTDPTTTTIEGSGGGL